MILRCLGGSRHLRKHLGPTVTDLRWYLAPSGRGCRDCRCEAHHERMSDREDFLTWVSTALYDAEFALHNGDSARRKALWSREEPVSVLGAWRNAQGQREVDELFTALGESFSDCTSYVFELRAYDVVGDLAY